MAKPGEVEQKWWVVDATDKVVGRLASDIAVILMGKHRPTYTPHVDTGDFVVVVNVEKVAFTGKKWDQKKYTWYTGYTRLRSETAAQRRAEKPEKILTEAVRRMLPKNKLAAAMLSKLKVYAGGEHPNIKRNPPLLETIREAKAKTACRPSKFPPPSVPAMR
jgi:large subunit ribosomal protein L13